MVAFSADPGRDRKFQIYGLQANRGISNIPAGR